MPTLFSIFGFKIIIYTHDHRPAHVHAIGPDGAIVYELDCPSGPPDVREVRGKITLTQVRKIARAVESEIPMLCDQWRHVHGKR